MAPDDDADWQAAFDAWLEPFLAALGHKARRGWAPLYLRGLLGPGARKSVAPLAQRVAPGAVQQLHHFVAASPWPVEPLEAVLAAKADELVGGPDAVLVIDDTALPKQGKHSVGVARQYCGQLGKRANCQVLVSLTLARDEVPAPVALRLYLPESWCRDAARRRRAGVAEDLGHRPKWRIALDELDRLLAAGVRFGCAVADAGYGARAAFRQGLAERGLTYAVGILPTQKVYPGDVTIAEPARRPTGRPPKHPIPSATSTPAKTLFEGEDGPAWTTITWRRGTKGPLAARFAALRVRVADGPANRRAQHLPGEAAWLVGEERAGGERKYYLTNHPPGTPLAALATAIKARWVCEQAHQQLKRELGLGHYEGRGWLGLHHHLVLAQIALAFLQHLRLRGKKRRRVGAGRRPAAGAESPRHPAPPGRAARRGPADLPVLPAAVPLSPARVNLAE
jgi:SRSO17 transposase